MKAGGKAAETAALTGNPKLAGSNAPRSRRGWATQTRTGKEPRRKTAWWLLSAPVQLRHPRTVRSRDPVRTLKKKIIIQRCWGKQPNARFGVRFGSPGGAVYAAQTLGEFRPSTPELVTPACLACPDARGGPPGLRTEPGEATACGGRPVGIRSAFWSLVLPFGAELCFLPPLRRGAGGSQGLGLSEKDQELNSGKKKRKSKRWEIDDPGGEWRRRRRAFPRFQSPA